MISQIANVKIPSDQLKNLFDIHEERSKRKLQFKTEATARIVYLPPDRVYYSDYQMSDSERESAFSFFTSRKFSDLSSRISKGLDNREAGLSNR